MGAILVNMGRFNGPFVPLLRDGFRTPVSELALGDDPVARRA